MTHDPTGNGLYVALRPAKAVQLSPAPALAWVSLNSRMFNVEPLQGDDATSDPIKLSQDFGAPGVIDLSAHGRQEILELQPGDPVRAYVSGVGLRHFKIIGSRSFQVLEDPYNTPAWQYARYAHYKSLASGAISTSAELWPEIYGGAYPLVLATCISRPGNPAWGRRFVFGKDA